MDSVPQFRQVLSALGRSFAMPIFAAGVTGAERAMLGAGIANSYKKPVLIITPDEASATRLAEDIAQLCSADSVALYPIRDLRFRSAEGASAEYEQKRLSVLGRVLDGSCKIVVSSVEAALQFTVPPGTYRYNTFSIKRGDNAEMEELAKRLSRAGYERRSQVDGPCQFSVRGGILDFFSPQSTYPVRIEFWGEGHVFFDYKRLRLPVNRVKSNNFPEAYRLVTANNYVAPWMNFFIIPSAVSMKGPDFKGNPDFYGVVKPVN